MMMTRFEKLFVNRKKKAKHNIEQVKRYLHDLDIQSIQDVLEIGCGIGSLSAYLSSEHGMNVYGTDFDPKQIRIAREKYRETDVLHFRIEDASKLAFKDNNFDLVVSQDVFHHIAVWPQAVSEVARVLRLGGHFIWMDMVFPGAIKKLFKPFVKNYGLYTLDDIEIKFREHGFDERAHERLIHGPFVYHRFVLQKV